MGEIEIRESETLVLPHTGEVLELADMPGCVSALQDMRSLEEQIRHIKRVLTATIAAESKRVGSKTLTLPDGAKVEIRGGSRVLWDTGALERGLRDAGMPEERIREIVREEVSYTVVAREANRAATANEQYAEAVEAAKTTVEEQPTIGVTKLR